MRSIGMSNSRKRAEQALAQSEAYFRSVVENISDVVTVLRSDGTIVYESPSLKPALHHDPVDVIGKNAFEFIHPDDAAAVRGAIARAIEAPGTSQAVEVRFMGGDSRWHTLASRSIAFPGDGGIAVIVVTSRDITESKQVQAADALWHEIDGRVLQGEGMEALQQFLCARLSEMFDAALVWIGLKEAGGLIGFNASSDRNGLTAPGFYQGHPLPWDDTPTCENMPGLAIRTGQTQFSTLEDQAQFPWHARAAEFNLQAAISLPLRDRHQTLGAITLFAQHRDILAPRTVQHLEHVAGLVSSALAAAAAQQQLRLQSAAIATAANAIFITDRYGRIQWVNEAFTRMSGYAPGEAVGQTPRLLKSGKQSLAYYRELWRTVLSGHPWRSEVVERHKDGRLYTVDQTITPLKNAQGDVTHFVAIHEDITAKKEAAARILHMAQHDALTHLPNRVLLRDRLQQMLHQAKRRQLKVGLLFLDLDRFKLINDTFGHDVGDLLLKAVADRLRKCVREVDTVARLGGDEFTILLPDLHDAQGAVRVAETILPAVAAPYHLEGCEVYTAASIGIVLYPADAMDADSLLKYADTAMYRAKQQGGNTYEFFTVEMQARVRARLETEHALRKALDQQEFEVHYQPFFELSAGTIMGIEALVRWRNPSGKLMMPAELIPIAEETGLIIALGEWVLRRACSDARVLHDQGFSPLRLAVNVSARQFRQPGFTASVAGILQETRYEAAALELEFTESIFLHDTEAALETLRKLKDLGVKLSIDDFGTGFSSLRYLKRCPIDTLKIDQSFVRDLASNPNDTAIVTAILAPARTLKLRVIAEGVEAEAQRTMLDGMGCHEAQGFLYSRPLPLQELTALLKGRAVSRQS